IETQNKPKTPMKPKPRKLKPRKPKPRVKPKPREKPKPKEKPKPSPLLSHGLVEHYRVPFNVV
ncbi:unnamed protein product, partial [Coccothraustes coccothraustes]